MPSVTNCSFKLAAVVSLLLCYFFVLDCHAQPMVTIELRSHGQPDNVGGGAVFLRPFESISNLSDEDYANSDLGNGIRVETRSGKQDRFSGDVSRLLDGFWPSGVDEPEENFYFEDSGLLLFDLRQPINLVEFNSYSRHRGGATPQRFRLYASSDLFAPSTNGNLVSNGWELLASVNMLTEPELPIVNAGFNGVAGVSIEDEAGAAIGQYQFLLFEARGVGADGRIGTFYSEFDIVGSPNPVLPPQCDLSRDDRCDVVDLQLLMSAGNLVVGVEVLSEFDMRRDLNDDMIIDQMDLDQWLLDAARVNDVARYYRGDANLDGSFNSNDLVQVFQVGQFEDNVSANSVWATGDWNGDHEFTTSDFVVAFQDGGYDRIFMSAVPEPSGCCLLLVGATVLLRCRQRPL